MTTGKLTDTQRRAALSAILEACSTTPEEMDAKRMRELRTLPALEGINDKALRQVITALTLTDLLWLAPQFRTNSARYVTTRLGKQVLKLYREEGG